MSDAADPRTQAQAAFGAPGTGSSAGRPSKAGFWVGGALMVAATAAAVVWLVSGIAGFVHAVDHLERVDVPGTRSLVLGAGRQAVFYEGPGGEEALVPDLRLRITPAGGGAPLTVGPYAGSVTYSMGGYSGRSAAGFQVPRSGRYTVRVAVPGGAPPHAVVAVGRGLGGKLVHAIVGAVVFFVAGLLLGSGLIILTSVRRSRR